ncbi:MAG: hypothetical protein K0R82_807 [Flavipsychrobacter sp.]|jgi:hypothetical protein|nr:hypothetical protein [Flavipsychrobacter sp.]
MTAFIIFSELSKHWRGNKHRDLFVPFDQTNLQKILSYKSIS